MDKTLSTICGLLSHSDNRRRCGAALILAELKPRQKDVVKALGEAIDGSSEQQLSCILEALDAIGSADAIPYVLPLLSSPDIPTKMRAVSIMAHGGRSVIPLITEQMEQAPRQYKMVFIDLLARIHSKESMQILLNMLGEKDFQLVKETCEAVRRHVADASPAKRKMLHDQVASFMRSKKASSERVTASCLLIIGNIGMPTALTILAKYLKPQESPYLRKNALVGLKTVSFTTQGAAKAWKIIQPLLKDDDPDVVRHSLDVLSRLPASQSSRTNWKKLLKSKAPAVRAVAAGKLSSGDSLETARFLITLLKTNETDVQETAARALCQHKKAYAPLVSELASSSDADYSWRLVKILKPHAASIDKKAVAKLKAMAAKDMLTDNPRYEAILYLLRHCARGISEEVLLEAGLAYRKAKHWEKAVDCLRKLVHTDLFTDEVAYTLSICNLKLSHKDLAPLVREKDHALRGFQSAIHRSPREFMAKLAKDRSLDASDLFYVAFHFSEGQGSEHSFGEDLFKHLIKKWPKSKEAKAARKKLGLSAATKKTSSSGSKKPSPKKRSDTRKGTRRKR